MPKRYLTLLCLGLIIIIFTTGCGKKEETAKAPLLVKTQTISADNSAAVSTYAGSVHGRYETNLSFQVSGKILRRNVQTGDRINAGDVLMILDSKDIIQQVNQSDAQVEATYSQLALARTNLSRYEQLYSQNVIAEAALDQYKTSYDAAVSSYQQAVAQAFQSHNALSYTNLTADADGVISALSAETGQVISAGQTVLTLVQTNELEVEINVPENQMKNISEGKEVKVSFWAFDNSTTDGIIREIAPMADAAARTYRVRVSLPTPPKALRLGMTASVTCQADTSDTNAYILPLSAIYQTGSTPEVWLVSSDNTVSLKKVQISSFDDNHVKVLGITEGDIVVTAGVQKLRDGQKVRTDDIFVEGNAP